MSTYLSLLRSSQGKTLAFSLQRFAVRVKKTRETCACFYTTFVEQSLTFRGEALSSLCALSQVSVLTRHQVAISVHAPCKTLCLIVFLNRSSITAPVIKGTYYGTIRFVCTVSHNLLFLSLRFIFLRSISNNEDRGVSSKPFVQA